MQLVKPKNIIKQRDLPLQVTKHILCTLTVLHNPLSADTAQRHYERMDLLIVHLSGPMSTPTWTSKTRVLIVELLATKNDATEALKTIIRQLECESGQNEKDTH
jgi:hypothetical protein